MKWTPINKTWRVSFEEPYPIKPDTSQKELEKWGTTISNLILNGGSPTQIDEMYKWLDTLPEMKKHLRKCKSWEKKQVNFLSNDFQNSKWFRSGVQIQVSHTSNAPVDILIIGDINLYGGLGECESKIEDDYVVLFARDLLGELND